MKNLLRSIGMVAALGLAGGIIPAQADGVDADRPGSFQAIMATKSPGAFGPHQPAADQAADPAAGNEARAGSFKAVMATKAPGTFGTHPAGTGSAQTSAAPANNCVPGSFAAIMAAKNPPNARPGNQQLYKDCR